TSESSGESDHTVRFLPTHFLAQTVSLFGRQGLVVFRVDTVWIDNNFGSGQASLHQVFPDSVRNNRDDGGLAEGGLFRSHVKVVEEITRAVERPLHDVLRAVVFDDISDLEFLAESRSTIVAKAQPLVNESGPHLLEGVA